MANLHSVYLCDKHRADMRLFSRLNPKVVETQTAFEKAFVNSTSRTLWVSFHIDELVQFLAKMAIHRQIRQTAKLPMLLVLERIQEQQGALLRSLFRLVVEAGRESFLPKDQLAEVLASDNAPNLAIGGIVDPKSSVIALVRGDLSLPVLVVPFSAFKETAAGAKPNFKDFEIIDGGQTIRLGKYEAAVDALLYEFDPEYRRHHKMRLRAAEKSFGASLRRLRLQKGLTQADFPGITEKEVGRIERGDVKRPHEGTISQLAKILDVSSAEIETF